MQLRASVMGRLWMTTGWKLRILGNMSMGLSVPDVMTTDWNFSKTGRMASEASRQLSWMTGSGIEGSRSSKGSMMMAKPLSYVPISVAKSATSWTPMRSSVSTISSVRIREFSRE